MNAIANAERLIDLDPLAEFSQWAKQRGIRINSIAPLQIPGKGMGIVAQRRIEAGEELVNVSASAFLTVNSIPREFRILHEGITAHALLASFLAFGGTELDSLKPWIQTWPSQLELKDSMPLLWLPRFGTVKCSQLSEASSANIVHSFPPAIEGRWGSQSMKEHAQDSCSRYSPGLLEKQERKLYKDWDIVSKVFPSENLETFAYFWLLVNTRSFYFKLSKVKGLQTRNDHVVMCPFIDCFNHNDQGCHVVFNDEGYTVTSDRIYEFGEEIFVSYGSHNNDLLLVECMRLCLPFQCPIAYFPSKDGFILEDNKWDSLPIDDLVLTNEVGTCTQQKLENAGYLGNYILSREGVCHRTQVAVRINTMDFHQWKRFVNGTYEPNPNDEQKADIYIVQRIMDVYYAEATNAMKALASPDCKIKPYHKATLTKRWAQIQKLIMEAFQTVNPYSGLSMASWSKFIE